MNEIHLWPPIPLMRLRPLVRKTKRMRLKGEHNTMVPVEGGYRGIEKKVKADFAAKGCPLEKVDRYLIWLRAHKFEKGDMTDYVKDGKKIEAIKKDVQASAFVPKGQEDILAKALGKAEHLGRVRGVTNGIGIKEYSGTAPKNPPPIQLKEKFMFKAPKTYSV